MNLVLTAHDSGLGGTQTYALTVAEQLQRLGHEVVFFSGEPGDATSVARDRGVPVAENEGQLPDAPDALLTQDAMMAYRFAERYPRVPQVFHCAGELFDVQLPPQLAGVAGALIVLSELTVQRVRALALEQEVVRLTQPIDTERFAMREAIRDRPRRALLFGSYLNGARRRLIIETWGEQGVECFAGGEAHEPELLIADADIVVAKGRAALEAMSCGRAVYVYDAFGTDGWVTPESYVAMEAMNFAGVATDAVPSAVGLRADLAGYRPEMGIANRDLVTSHHSARRHGEALVEIMRRLAPRAQVLDAPYGELARLVRLHWQTESRGFQAARENTALHQRLIDLELAVQGADLRATRAEQRYAALTSTRRYRLAAVAGRLADRLRGGS